MLSFIDAASLLMFSISRIFTGKAMFWGTPMLQFSPWWAQAWRTLQSGQLPLWNPLVGMGAPLLANYQSALLYPPTWVYFGLAAVAVRVHSATARVRRPHASATARDGTAADDGAVA